MGRIFLILLLSLIYISVFAQRIKLEINGLLPGKIYTKAQIVSALGQPTQYSTWNDEFGGGAEYRYGNDILRCENQRGLVDFILKSNKFSLYQGKIKVGGKLTDLTLLNLPDYKLESAGTNKYRFYPTGFQSDALIINVASGGIITHISFSVGD